MKKTEIKTLEEKYLFLLKNRFDELSKDVRDSQRYQKLGAAIIDPEKLSKELFDIFQIFYEYDQEKKVKK